jgi:hypothetical protein
VSRGREFDSHWSLILREKYHDLRLRLRQTDALIKLFFAILNSFLCFLENIFTSGFITSIASGNRFSLAVLSYLPVEKVIPTGP